MRTIFAEYNPQRDSIDVYSSAGYMLRIDCWEAEKNLTTSRIGYGIIGLLFSVFFIWIIINGANTFQKKVINIVHSKMDNKLTSGKREYCFDTDGITVSSDIGNGTNHWNAFKCWGIFRNYIYIRTIKNEMVLVNQNDLSENDVKELKSLLSQNLKEETL